VKKKIDITATVTKASFETMLKLFEDSWERHKVAPGWLDDWKKIRTDNGWGMEEFDSALYEYEMTKRISNGKKVA